MSAESHAVESAAEPRARLHVVTGKGGVGKSAFVGALALRAARAGARVLALELGAPGGLAGLLGVRPPAHGLQVAVPLVPSAEGSLSLAYFDGEQALADYLRRRMPLGGLLDAALAHPLYRAFVSAGPGVRELMAIGKVRDELLGLSTGHPCFDVVILDAGASGHALPLLGMPGATARTFSAGLAHREAARVAATLADPRTTAVHVVALPERMPLAEAAEIIARLRTLDLPVGHLVINQCRPPAPPGAEGGCKRLADAPTSDGARALLAAARRALRWLRIQEDGIAGLERDVGRSAIRLPRLIARAFGLPELTRLADALPTDVVERPPGPAAAPWRSAR